MICLLSIKSQEDYRLHKSSAIFIPYYSHGVAPDAKIVPTAALY
jgi:hypothetical protein